MNPISQTALAARKSAHWLGLRLADRSIREEAFFLSNRDDLEPSLNSGSICSGDAGVMTILNRLAIEFPDDRALFRGAANEILNNLLSSEEIGDNSLFFWHSRTSYCSKRRIDFLWLSDCETVVYLASTGLFQRTTCGTSA